MIPQVHTIPEWAAFYNITKTVTGLTMIHYYSDCKMNKGQWFYPELNEWSDLWHYMITPDTASKLK